MSNVPKLRFKGFIEENRLQKFKEVVLSNTYGPRFNANDYDCNGNVKTIRGTDVTIDGYIKYNQVPTAQLDDKFIKSHILEDGDLVMITTADCGLTGIFEEQNEKYICSAYAVKIALNKSLAYPYYFKYYFQTALAKNEVNKYIRKATVANLPASDILKFSHRLPIKQEQEKIASFLTSVDEKIEQLIKKEELLQQYKKGIMQKIFNQEIRFKADDGSEFCDWEEKKLGDILDYIQPTKYLVKDTEYNDSYTIPVLTAGKTFILGYTNETDGVFENNLPVIIFDDFTTANKFVNFPFKAKSSAMKILVSKNNNIKFIYEAIQMIKYEVGGHERHWISKFSFLNIFIPCIEEQTKIANFLSSIDSKIEEVKKQLNSKKKFKKALLQQMFV
ncbi:restriction endonuclease subunit S [Aliarcobacter cryaerophilus]|uniref:restriction endonuclease subunit S n=1 Tax=Aliarcobacter cryaerophilus TaxID=28198 RepID=UPI0021B22567|nr:restriction endonuclease subunit S [Aliarcobacter cryaerophilus]MCT7511719.1 restriction endonuclease subunit S [Aliarcobacter cryaerophilus]